MTFGIATYGLGLVAGALSTLSPCVLPLVPLLIASAVNAHRWGAVALGAGLALSFAIIGIFLATVGASLGLDPDTFRTAGAVILAIFGLILLVPKLQNVFATATGALSNSGSDLLARVTFEGFPEQFLVGLLLGVVWSPCVGPTLGAATTLASQGSDLGQIALLMLIFGVGAAAPLVLLGSLSRASLTKVRGRLLHAGKVGRQGLGMVMLVLGILIVTGLDKSLEGWVLDRTPDWLTALTTKF
ncbi:MAG TPA: cytochrome c biogenesis CcdA family protein [Steroidobacteraceae bacterium]|nr:cytochrome c biogenesis CcdA family protein [Steroidobacteraceae bacterium]